MAGSQDPSVFRTILEGLHTGVYLVGTDGKILFWNDGAERITGYRRHEVVGSSRRDNILVHCDEKHCVFCGAACPFAGASPEGQSGEVQLFFHHKAGHRVPVHLRMVPMRDQTGAVVGNAESFDEKGHVFEPEAGPDNLAARACVDAITGVMNPVLTRSYLREQLAFFAEYDLSFGILSMRIQDLQRFQTLHGREAAHDILHAVAETMKNALGTGGFLGRWSEDQFVAIVPNCSADELGQTGDHIQTAVNSSRIRLSGDFLSVSVSVDSAMVQAGDQVESLLERTVRPVGEQVSGSSLNPLGA